MDHVENLKKLKSYHNGSYGASIKVAIRALIKERKRKEKEMNSNPAITIKKVEDTNGHELPLWNDSDARYNPHELWSMIFKSYDGKDFNDLNPSAKFHRQQQIEKEFQCTISEILFKYTTDEILAILDKRDPEKLVGTFFISKKTMHRANLNGTFHEDHVYMVTSVVQQENNWVTSIIDLTPSNFLYTMQEIVTPMDNFPLIPEFFDYINPLELRVRYSNYIKDYFG